MSPDNTSHLIETIPFSVDLDVLREQTRLSDGDAFAEDMARLAAEAEQAAAPKGVYCMADVAVEDDTRVSIGGVTFTSRVLRVNLDGLHRAFPFVATCGQELEAWSKAFEDPMQQFLADTIKEMALGEAIRALGEHVAATFGAGKRSMMNPGSLEDWPMAEQTNLFALFGELTDTIGVSLTASYLMSPIKSVSGLWFETEQGFQNCQLCPREACPNRRAPYDPHLLGMRFGGE